ncbi:MAG: PFL_4669 family integrating conjugative element protein [Scandinavium sp.]|uniref:PFL_4669 family integrating conjugative element protein n=1 Tax=Scandinavium sp. TaxID=2830653 RepID=UPI003F3E264F
MSDTDSQYRFNSGPLRSTVIIELHTHHATRIWTGRKGRPDENIQYIIGFPRFISLMNTLRLDALADNPYADMWMLHMEERLLAARDELNVLVAAMETVFSQLPEMMTVEGTVSIQPARFPVFASTPLGFIAVYMLTDYDTLLRKALLAHHMALLTSTQKNELRVQAGRIIRSVLTRAQVYRRLPVTRQDIRNGNGRAKEAEALVGVVPDDIFDGTRRSSYAPPLRQPDEEPTVDGEDATKSTTETEEDASVVIPVSIGNGQALALEDDTSSTVDDGEEEDESAT